MYINLQFLSCLKFGQYLVVYLILQVVLGLNLLFSIYCFLQSCSFVFILKMLFFVIKKKKITTKKKITINFLGHIRGIVWNTKSRETYGLQL